MHSWPLYEAGRHFELGALHGDGVLATASAGTTDSVGMWECDLSDDTLIWSAGVYDIFRLPTGGSISREAAVALYCEGSRAVMERLRAYAIKHRRGFTLDAEILPDRGVAGGCASSPHP